MQPIGPSNPYVTKYDNNSTLKAQCKTGEPKAALKPAVAAAMAAPAAVAMAAIKAAQNSTSGSGVAAAACSTRLTAELKSMNFLNFGILSAPIAAFRFDSHAAGSAAGASTGVAQPYAAALPRLDLFKLPESTGGQTASAAGAVAAAAPAAAASNSSLAGTASPLPMHLALHRSKGSASAPSASSMRYHSEVDAEEDTSDNPHRVAIYGGHSEYTLDKQDLRNPHYEIHTDSLEKEDIVIAARACSNSRLRGLGLIVFNDDYEAAKFECFVEKFILVGKTLPVLELEVYFNEGSVSWNRLKKVVEVYRHNGDPKGVKWIGQLKIIEKFCARGFKSVTIQHNGVVAYEKAD